ncbi:MAG: ATP synthase F1 subunit delta [Chloroflexota bacterium]
MPESNVGVARQYAEAMYQLATDNQRVADWLEQLGAVSGALARPDIGQLLASPAIAERDKFDVLRRSLAGVDALVLNLVFLLVRRRRLSLVVLIASEYARLVNRQRGIVLADVTTAVPLDAAETAALASRLSAALGKTVQVRATVDNSIIGGLVVRIGDKLINGSVAGRLESLRLSLA